MVHTLTESILARTPFIYMRNVKHYILIGSVSAVVAATGLSGCASWSRQKEARETGRTPTQVADDRHISDRVASSLKASPVYKFPDVGVKTFDRVVQLHGFVQTDDQKRAAEEIAQQAPGAVRVINDIVVQPQATEAQNAQPPSLAPTGRINQTNTPSGS
jgi:BON domain